MDLEFLKEMLGTSSVSGCEIGLQKKVLAHYKPYMDTMLTDYTGNVIGVINPEHPVKVLLSGHIDEIGLIVTGVDSNGLIHVMNAGGIYASTYLGHQVIVEHEGKQVYGNVVITRELAKKDVKAGDLLIDIGTNTKEETLKHVSIGDPIHFDNNIRELLDDKLTSRAIDDRGGAFIVMEAVKKAKELGCKCGAYASSSVGEETSMRGAYFASGTTHPTMAIVVDVTYATDYPGTDPFSSGKVELGKGPVLCHSSIVNDKLNAMLKSVASKHNIPLQEEVFVGRTGTDADKIHVSQDGVPVCLVSFPLRYMHSPNETCDKKDVQNAIDLIAHLLCEIDENTNISLFD